MISMIKKISKELIDNKFATKNKKTWYNFSLEIGGIKYKVLVNNASIYYIPDEKEYSYIDYLVSPKEANEYQVGLLSAADQSELLMDDLVEAQFNKFTVLTCDSLTIDGLKSGYDVKLLNKFPKKNVTYSTTMVQNSPLLVIRQKGRLIGAIMPVRSKD